MPIIQNINDFTPPNHMSIVSQTGGGKTVIGSRIFDNLKHRAIFCNFNMETYFKKHVEFNNIKSLPEALRKSRKISILSDDVRLFEATVKYIWDFKRKNKKFLKEEVFFFFDEIQEYSDIKIINDVFTRGRKWHIHGIPVVRQIQEMKNLKPIRECMHKLFLRLSPESLVSIHKNYGIKIPQFVLSYINSGHYIDGIFHSNFYGVLYDGITWFIFDKNGNIIDSFTVTNLDGLQNVENENQNTGKSENQNSKDQMESIKNPKKNENNQTD